MMLIVELEAVQSTETDDFCYRFGEVMCKLLSIKPHRTSEETEKYMQQVAAFWHQHKANFRKYVLEVGPVKFFKDAKLEYGAVYCNRLISESVKLLPEGYKQLYFDTVGNNAVPPGANGPFSLTDFRYLGWRPKIQTWDHQLGGLVREGVRRIGGRGFSLRM